MANVIVVQQADNSVHVVYTAASTLSLDEIILRRFADSDATYTIVDNDVLPAQTVFFNAWVYDETYGAIVDVSRAKDIAHNIRRDARTEEMKPYDDIIAKQIPGEDAVAAESQRAVLRTKYATKQTEIDNATTAEQLQSIVEELIA